MNRGLKKTKWYASLIVLAILGSNAYADDLPLCSNGLSAPPIFISGASALEPLVKAMGKILASQTDPAKKFSLVYVKDGSCEGVRKFVASGTPAQTTTIAKNTQPYYIDASFDPAKDPPKCSLSDQPEAGVAADVGFSDVYVEVCTGAARPNEVADILGPAQAMLFITHPNSSQSAITAEEAYLAFGLGAEGQATPWSDPNYFFIRNNSSGTKHMLAAAIGVPAAKWKGIYSENGKDFSSKDVRAKVAAQATNAEKTIGILGADILDEDRKIVKALAFRGFKQKRAYWPDSTPTSFDKQNVRDGHYLPFGYAHIIAKTDGNGNLTNTKAKLLVDLLTQAADLSADFKIEDSIKVITQTAHLVPECAMKVKRTNEGGDLSLFTSDNPCHCFFESIATGAKPANCTVCTDDKPCGTGKCRYGFCEAK